MPRSGGRISQQRERSARTALPAIRHDVRESMFVRSCGAVGEARRILYIHGLGESALCFERLLVDPELRSWHHIAPDLPGYGKSPWKDPPLDLVELADRLAGFVESWDPPPIIVGHSMGGVIGLLIAERHPGAVRGLIDVEGNKTLPDCVFSGKAVGQSESEFLNGGFDALREEIYLQGLEHPARRGYYASLRLCDPRAFRLNSIDLTELSRTDDLGARLGAVNLPAHFIAGSPDGVAAGSLDSVRRAGVPLTVIRPAGHWPFLDQPGEFVQVFRRVLTSMTG